MRVNANRFPNLTAHQNKLLDGLLKASNEAARAERKRKASESKDEMIALLLPPKSDCYAQDA